MAVARTPDQIRASIEQNRHELGQSLDKLRAEVTEPIIPARDAEGKIDVQGTMQAITSVIEGWVREYPDQWLWLHRRWR